MEFVILYTYENLRSEDISDELIKLLSSRVKDPILDGSVDNPGVMHVSITVEADSLDEAWRNGGDELGRAVADIDDPGEALALDFMNITGAVIFRAESAETLRQV